jgi:hypothetical protein
LRVAPGSPAAATDLTPFFDFIAGYEGGGSAQAEIGAAELERIVEAHEGRVLNLLVWNSQNQDTRCAFDIISAKAFYELTVCVVAYTNRIQLFPLYLLGTGRFPMHTHRGILTAKPRDRRYLVYLCVCASPSLHWRMSGMSWMFSMVVLPKVLV